MSLWGNKDLKAITGTSIAVTQNNANIVGTGTTFTTDLKEGSIINISGVPYKIFKITDDTHLSLVTQYIGATNATINITGGTVAATALVVGTAYKISVLGTTTNWNTIAGTTGVTYAVGNVITATVVGTGDGSTTSIPVFTQTSPTFLVQAPTVAAGSFSVGNQYTITFVGNTDFTTLGASANTVGVKFIATGSGTAGQTGTAVDAHPENDLSKIVFVSLEEAQLASNKAKGIHGSGWYRINTYVDSDGNTRFKTEMLVQLSTPQAISQDAPDDALVDDVNVIVTIGTQPTATYSVAGGTATMTVAATAVVKDKDGNTLTNPTATLTYQWQRAASGSTKYTNLTASTINGATFSNVATTALGISGLTSANIGEKYRLVINSTPNAIVPVTSTVASLVA